MAPPFGGDISGSVEPDKRKAGVWLCRAHKGFGECSSPSRTKYATPEYGAPQKPSGAVFVGKEEQGSVCSFRRKAGTKQGGLCDDARTAPATVYKCALVNKGLMACPRILAGLQSIPQPPEDGIGQSKML